MTKACDNTADDGSLQPESRRGFLRESSFLIAGAIPGKIALEPPATSEKKVPQRIAILGCGRRGTQLAQRLLDQSPGATIVAVADVLPDAIQRCVRTLSSKYRDQLDIHHGARHSGLCAEDRVFNDPLDTIVLAGSPADRPKHIERAISAGNQVVSARPLAIDKSGLERVERALAAANAKNLDVQVPNDLWLNSNVQQSAQFVAGGGIGHVVSLRAFATGRPLPGTAQRPKESTEVNQIRNWQHFARLSGGGPLEELVDRLDVCNQIAGGLPLSAQGISPGNTKPNQDPVGPSDTLSNLAVELRYQRAWLHAFWKRARNDWSGPTLTAHGTNGWCDILGGRCRDHDNAIFWQADNLLDPPQQTTLPSANCPFAALRANRAAIMARDAAMLGKRISQDDIA